MRRAVLGGSFDPVHRGHVAMVQAILKADLAEVVHIIPAWRSPFKDHATASAQKRLAMVGLAFAGVGSIQIETMEIDRSEVSYTVDSLAELRQRYPADTLFLVVGADNLPDLPQWNRVKEISAMASLIILGRNQQPVADQNLKKCGFSNSMVFTLPHFDYPVSSTEVRSQLENEYFSAEALPAAVADFIRSHELYKKS